MAASLLAAGQSTLEGAPDLADVRPLNAALSHMVMVVNQPGSTLTLDTSKITQLETAFEMVRTIRASILVLGSLLARFGKAIVSLPRGCRARLVRADHVIAGRETDCRRLA